MPLARLRIIEVLTLKKETELTPGSDAFRQHIRNLHLDGMTPDEIAAQVACPEAVVWKTIRGLYIVQSKLSDAYRQLRVERVFVLKKQGLEMLEIKDIMGFAISILNKDMREMPQKKTRVTSRRKNTRRTQNG